ncbi:hypothetical protein [uncultured Umboniibacter sp.]|uniref:hypothetical protein n=1 Tax=uncultured Umboniibacter sp. TaxID=1798917 RepID=UPI0026378AD1|nr:hypothetical protein [uncultured Umboniibacter sp.]
MVTFVPPSDEALSTKGLEDLDNLDDFFYRLQRKAIDETEMSQGLSCFGRLVGASKVDLISFSTTRNTIKDHWHTHSSGIRDWLYRWPYGAFRFQPITDALNYSGLHVASLAQSLELRSLEAPSGLEKAYLSCLGISDYCSMSFSINSELRAILIFSRSAIEAKFNRNDMRDLERVAVKAKQSFTAYWTDDDNFSEYAEQNGAIQGKTQPCVVLDTDHSVLYSSRSFQEFCQTSEIIRISDEGDIVCSDQDFCDSLRQASDLTLSTSVTSELNALRVVPVPDNETLFALVSRSEFNNLGAIQIEFYEGDLIPTLKISDITENLRATPGEAKLCVELVRSGDLIGAAHYCNLNLKTAKLFLNSLLTRNRLSSIQELQQTIYQLFK